MYSGHSAPRGALSELDSGPDGVNTPRTWTKDFIANNDQGPPAQIRAPCLPKHGSMEVGDRGLSGLL
jgi:hypothetical protein